MKILIITQKMDINDPILGFFHRWVEEFAKVYEHVTVICLQEGKHNLPQNVKVLSLGKETKASWLRYIFRFYKIVIPIIFRRKTDQIFVHMNEIYILMLAPLLPIRRLRHIPLLWWKCHGHLSCQSKLARFFTDKILTASIESFPIDISKKRVVGHGIDTKRFCFLEENTRNDNLIMAVGRYSPSKRYEDLIEAVVLLKKEGINITVSVFGAEDPQAPEYKKNLEKLIREKKLEDIFILEESVLHEEIVECYKNAGIIVNTSDTDSLDKVVLEAMACGTIPISSNLAYRKMLKPHGLDIKKRDAEDLAEKIKTVFSLPENKKMQLQKEMREKVVVEHNLSKLIRNIYSL